MKARPEPPTFWRMNPSPPKMPPRNDCWKPIDSSIPGVAAMKPCLCTMNSLPGATSIGRMWPGNFEAKAMEPEPPCAVYVVIMKLAPETARLTAPMIPLPPMPPPVLVCIWTASDIQENSPASETTASPSASESSSTGIVVPWIVSSILGLLALCGASCCPIGSTPVYPLDQVHRCIRPNHRLRPPRDRRAAPQRSGRIPCSSSCRRSCRRRATRQLRVHRAYVAAGTLRSTDEPLRQRHLDQAEDDADRRAQGKVGEEDGEDVLVGDDVGNEDHELVLYGQGQGDHDEDDPKVRPHQTHRAPEGVGDRTLEQVDEGAHQRQQRCDDQPRHDEQQRGDRAHDEEDHLRQDQADPRQRRQDLAHGLGRLVALDRADQAFEHAAVESEAQRRHAEDDDVADRLQSQMVGGDLGEPGALECIEAKDHQRGDDDSSRLEP